MLFCPLNNSFRIFVFQLIYVFRVWVNSVVFDSANLLKFRNIFNSDLSEYFRNLLNSDWVRFRLFHSVFDSANELKSQTQFNSEFEWKFSVFFKIRQHNFSVFYFLKIQKKIEKQTGFFQFRKLAPALKLTVLCMISGVFKYLI